MDCQTFGSRKQTEILLLTLLAAASSLSGCALSRMSGDKIAARSTPGGIPPALAEDQNSSSRQLDLPTTAAKPAGVMVASRVAHQAAPQRPSPPTQRPGGQAVLPAARGASPRPPDAPPLPAPAEPRFAGEQGAPTVLHADEVTFDRQVLQSNVPVLVDFYASWCGPCKSLAPTLEALAAEMPQAKVVKVDIDDSPELAARYGVRSVPSLMVFKSGQITAKQTGVASESRLKAMLDL